MPQSTEPGHVDRAEPALRGDELDDDPETPESAAATRKVMALVAMSLVSVIDVASYVYARQKPGVFAIVAIPMALVTLVVLGFSWRALRATEPAN